MTWILLAAVTVVATFTLMACRPSRTDAATSSQASGDSGTAPVQSFAEVPLFANDVSIKKPLPLSLSVETLGGVSTMLIPRGTALPTTRRETFSTASDNQSSIEVHVLVGDRTLAVDNMTVGKFSIVEIPAAPRGVPTFEVAFSVDEHGTFRFSATDLATGNGQRVSSARVLSHPLSEPKVLTMLGDARAEEAKTEYGVPKTTPDELDSLTIYTKRLRDLAERTRAALSSGSTIPETARRRCDEQLRNADRILQATALPERASAKLNTLKVDEIEAALHSLDEAAKQCR